MSDLDGLRGAVIKLSMLQKSVAALNDDSDNGWRQQHINYRREIQHQFGVISALAKDVTTIDAEERAAFGAALSRMRTALALHQADWPVVAIKLDDPRYNQSSKRVRTANQEFNRIANEMFANHGLKGNS